MILIVYIPCSSDQEARTISRALLEQKLIACANIMPITSMYWWKGEIQDDAEFVILAKTVKSKYQECEQLVQDIHSYDTPCIVAWTTDAESKQYSQWVSTEVIEPREV